MEYEGQIPMADDLSIRKAAQYLVNKGVTLDMLRKRVKAA